MLDTLPAITPEYLAELQAKTIAKTRKRISEARDELILLAQKGDITLTAREKDLVRGIFFGLGIDSYNRFPTLWKLRKDFSCAQYYYALGCAYSMSDNLYDYRKEVRKAFTLYGPRGRHFLMDGRERRKLANLPEEVTIYRAMTEAEARGRTYGVSWTLSIKVAEYFRDHYRRNHSTNHLQKVIKEKVVKKEDIIALFCGRDEQEIIYVN